MFAALVRHLSLYAPCVPPPVFRHAMMGPSAGCHGPTASMMGRYHLNVTTTASRLDPRDVDRTPRRVRARSVLVCVGSGRCVITCGLLNAGRYVITQHIYTNVWYHLPHVMPLLNTFRTIIELVIRIPRSLRRPAAAAPYRLRIAQQHRTIST